LTRHLLHQYEAGVKRLWRKHICHPAGGIEGQHLLVHCIAYWSDDKIEIVGLGEKWNVRRQIARPVYPSARCDNDLDRRPSIANKRGKFQPIYCARHIDVGEDHPDFGMPSDNGNCGFGAVGFVQVESSYSNSAALARPLSLTFNASEIIP